MQNVFINPRTIKILKKAKTLSMWSSKDWSVFGLSVRTNNDVEGYHRLLNSLNRYDNINLYLLLETIDKEFQFVKKQCQLLSEEKLTRYQRNAYKMQQFKIFRLWDRYRSKCLTPHQFFGGNGKNLQATYVRQVN